MRHPFFCFILFVFSFPAVAQSPSFQTYMQAQAAHYEFNGNVLVAKKGKVLYEGAFGYRHYESKSALDTASVFDLASVSKQMTAMGILLLVDKGKLQLGDSLRHFFPELPYYGITIHHLLTHTSGLPDYMDAMHSKWDKKKIAFNGDVIRFLATEKPQVDFSPGVRWAYSNTGYVMLASIIEKATGKSFATYMQEHVFGPLGMKHTRIYNTRRSTNDTIPNYAYGYVLDRASNRYMLPDSLPQFDFVRYLDGIQGDGIIQSTTGDLLKWDRALKYAALLSHRLQNDMVSPQAYLDSTKKRAYGYGVFVSDEGQGLQQYHSGGWPGYHTYLLRHLDEDITIIVLSNNGSASGAITNALLHIALGKPVVVASKRVEAVVDTAILARYAGRYANDFTLELYMQDGRLYRRGTMPVRLLPVSETLLFYGDGSDRQLEFEVDPSGRATSLNLINYGVRYKLEKVQ